ncbi:uncharacterized protein LOC125467987 isoform X1 [Pyrus x bretschneideri]|uniref:uncharacterized protein LOC125467987 isoform X1 n=2 Tax=Pyrus x bretschneideri TaxID=225117 RepID=UPI00202F01CB|nr:uncharacterized protein LOC125467987 isoform X1 [Pyrus x bretschneideri]
MAYIPAHKRPLPTPELLAPQFWKQGMHTVFSADTRPTAPAAARGGRPGTFRGRGKGYRGISGTSGMGYVPPHKWHSKESERPLLTSELRAQRFKKNLYAKPYNKSNVDWTRRIAIADHSTYRWCAAAARGGRPDTLHSRGKGYRGFRGGITARSGMAHIPPHKQHSKEYERPLLTSELHAQRFKKNLYVKPYNKSNVDWTGRIAHADHSTYRWCAVGLGEKNQFPPSVNLKPICLYSTEPKVEENRLALFNTSLDDGGSELKWNSPRSPGVSIAENVLADLVSSIKHMRNEMKCAQLKEGKPTLLARVGKVLFLRRPLFNMEAIRTSLSTEILKQWRQLLYTNIPVSYKERIENEVVPKIGVDFEGEKDTYQVKLSDSTRPDATLSCKCRVMKEHGKLQLYKIELNQLRNMVVDISCTTKNLDLRLMLNTKRLVTDLTDDEMQSIRDLINSAIIDPDVKGGLRWPSGKDSSGDKYKVDGVWHLIANTYKNSSFRLKVRRADRFDYRTLTGTVTWETILMLKRVLSKLQEENAEASSVSEILKEDMQLIWDNFLSCEGFLT